jgi:hypothetical protein
MSATPDSASSGAFFYAKAPVTLGNIIAREGPSFNFVTQPVRPGSYFLSSIGAANQNIPKAYILPEGDPQLMAIPIAEPKPDIPLPTGSGDKTIPWGA